MMASQEIIDQFVGAAHGDIETVKEMLAAHPELAQARASWSELAVEAGAQMGRLDIVEMLLEAGSPLDICTAAVVGDAHQVQAFLEADPTTIQASGAHGIPLLYFPAIRGDMEMAAMLVERGAAVNAGNGVNTPLHGAVMFNQVEMVSWLLAQGADTTLMDYNNRTPLELARENNLPEVASLLEQD